MKQNFNHAATNVVTSKPRLAHIIDFGDGDVIGEGGARELAPGPVLLLELAPSMERAVLTGQPLTMKMGLMVRRDGVVAVVILRAGRHVCIVAMNAGDAEVARLLIATKRRNALRVALVGDECQQLRVFGLDPQMSDMLERLADAAPMSLSDYLSAAHLAVTQACSPEGMAAAGLDPRRVRSVGIFAHLGAAQLDSSDWAVHELVSAHLH